MEENFIIVCHRNFQTDSPDGTAPWLLGFAVTFAISLQPLVFIMIQIMEVWDLESSWCYCSFEFSKMIKWTTVFQQNWTSVWLNCTKQCISQVLHRGVSALLFNLWSTFSLHCSVLLKYNCSSVAVRYVCCSIRRRRVAPNRICHHLTFPKNCGDLLTLFLWMGLMRWVCQTAFIPVFH